MMNGTEVEIFNKYLEIKQDLIGNLRDVWNRRNTYIRKYRGNEKTNINVAVTNTEEGNKLLQIFVGYEKLWIKDVLIFNSQGLVSSKITTNLGEDV